MRTAVALLAMLALAACGDAPAPPTEAAKPAEAAAPAPAAAADDLADQPEVAAGDEAPGDPLEGEPDAASPDFSAAPWSAAPLPADAVPKHYLGQWRKADNRATCAPLAPADLGEHAAAVPRAATFSGGWAVAYDEPGLRSAFGIAGAGVEADGDDQYQWPYGIGWTDGSHAGYGPEGGTGPGHLAYLRVEGQGCLYNVWSKHGEAHLVSLLESLRFVDTK
jgi:hypothetical protein